MTTPEFTIKEITPEEHAARLRKELEGGLYKAVEARCDSIESACFNDSCCMSATVIYIQDQLAEILDLIRMSEENEKDDGR